MADRYKEVIVFLLNNNNEVLLLKRSKQEKHNANKWAPLAGHIEDFDNTIEDAAIREIKEELGISVNRDLLIEIPLNKEKITTKFYFTRIDTNDFVLQKEEVSEVKWHDISKVIHMMKNEDERFVSSKRIIIVLESINKK